MRTNDVKINADLVIALIKLKEASVLFEKQTQIIDETTGIDHIEERGSFADGLLSCMDAVGKMIGESAINEVHNLSYKQRLLHKN